MFTPRPYHDAQFGCKCEHDACRRRDKSIFPIATQKPLPLSRTIMSSDPMYAMQMVRAI